MKPAIKESSIVEEAVAGDTTRHHLYVRIAELAVAILVLGAIGFFMFRGGVPGKVTYVAPERSGAGAGTMVAAPPPPPIEKVVIVSPATVEGSPKQNIATADIKIFKAPVNFKSFSYDASVGKVLSLTGTCTAKYYALLIFENSVDYRKDPARARYNSAFPCGAAKVFNIDVNMKDFNLPSGNYYVFVADQGDTGSWYNPR